MTPCWKAVIRKKGIEKTSGENIPLVLDNESEIFQAADVMCKSSFPQVLYWIVNNLQLYKIRAPLQVLSFKFWETTKLFNGKPSECFWLWKCHLWIIYFVARMNGFFFQKWEWESDITPTSLVKPVSPTVYLWNVCVSW